MNKTSAKTSANEALKIAIEAMDKVWDEADFIQLAKAINSCKEALEPDRTGMVYYKNNACKAKDANSPDCICWTPEQPAQDDIIKSLQKVAEYFYDGKLRNLAVVDACEKAINKEAGKEIYKHSVLEQPAQEPVAVIQPDNYGEPRLDFIGTFKYKATTVVNPDILLYTHPAPSWQGLSDDEIEQTAIKAFGDADFVKEVPNALKFVARAIEQALKEKNT